jgi:SAM-dependent methyltransferase
MVMKPNWPEFFEATKDSQHHPLVERAVDFLGRPGDALDLGCGAGRDTRYLVGRGWRVTAVDSEAEAIALLAPMTGDRLKVVQSSFEDFEYEPGAFDLVSAQYSLPFIPRGAFFEVFDRIKQAIRSRGIFAGQFFGVHDEWNVAESNMTFLRREEVDRLLSDMDVVELTEEDRLGTTALGTTKQWHVFHVIAQKNTH